jgi:hypothetical protein
LLRCPDDDEAFGEFNGKSCGASRWQDGATPRE